MLRVPKTSLWLSGRWVVFSDGGAVVVEGAVGVGEGGVVWREGGEFFSLLIFFSLFTRERVQERTRRMARGKKAEKPRHSVFAFSPL